METNKELVQFDPSTIMQGVKDKIKASFIDLIPEEHWEAMVKKETDDFFAENINVNNNNVNNNNYNQSNFKSKFQLLLREVLHEECRKRLADYIQTSEFNTTYGTNGHRIASEETKKMMIDNSGVILANMFSGMFSGMFTQMEINLRSNGQLLRF